MFTANVRRKHYRNKYVELMRDSHSNLRGDVVGKQQNQQSAILRTASSLYTVLKLII